MQLVKPSIEHVDVTSDPIKAIEAAGRTCWKSEDRIAEGTAEKFVKMVMDKKHYAVVEHGNYILSVDSDLYEEILKIEDRQFIRMSCDVGGNGCLVSGNPAALRDFCLRPDIKSVIQRALAVELSKNTPILFDDTIRDTDHLSHLDTDVIGTVELFPNTDSLSISEKLKHQVASYRIVCNRGVTHEIVRHRLFSYAQESTRYCNYKGGVTYIIPPWIDIEPGEYTDMLDMDGRGATSEEIKYRYDNIDFVAWYHHMRSCEITYKNQLGYGWTPQQARSVLPNALKTEIVVTGNLREWRHFFKLRCSPKAHPQMQEVANMVLADIRTRVPVIFDEIG